MADNINRTHLVLASGKLELQKNIILRKAVVVVVAQAVEKPNDPSLIVLSARLLSLSFSINGVSLIRTLVEVQRLQAIKKLIC